MLGKMIVKKKNETEMASILKQIILRQKGGEREREEEEEEEEEDSNTKSYFKKIKQKNSI